MGFVEFFRRKLSWHYFKGPGEGFFSVLGSELDQAVDAAKYGVEARIPSRAPVEALPYIAQTFNLDYLPNIMDPGAARAYLEDPWTHWENAGTRARISAELAAIGYPYTLIISYRDLVDAGLPPTVFGGFSTFWYLYIGKPNPWGPPGRWGLPPLGDGGIWGAAPWPWGGSGMRFQDIELIRRVIKKWKPASTSCRFIEAELTSNMFGRPAKVVRWPVHEDWELQPNGGYIDFYNTGF